MPAEGEGGGGERGKKRVLLLDGGKSEEENPVYKEGGMIEKEGKVVKEELEGGVETFVSVAVSYCLTASIKHHGITSVYPSGKN